MDPPALSPVRGVSRCVVVALAVAGAAWTARGIWQIRLAVAGRPVSGPPDQGDGRHRPLTTLENAYHLVSTCGDLATVLCAIAFLAWLLRVRDNARALSGRRLRYGLPWVCLGWVVPIANFWVPRGIVAEVHRAGDPEARLPRSVNLWWGLWLIGALSGVGLMYADSTDAVIARAYSDVTPLLVADAAVVGAALACALMVRALTGAQQRRIEALRPVSE
ncbi:DUF4328 domain-containing protein [Streptomyces sp. MH60]|uniref:DUF4328 domain-containing protein n=1 Tax=Streptomyces sp. MH60 TaxID=1940758 RepID=UPI000CEF536D|nr:DUF4328 domain-containing protein [Streptomyces sp. MH60]